jgi:hypothetical protein
VERDFPKAAVVWAVVGSVIAYAALGAYQQRWPSMVAGSVVAVLLACSHRRARFAAYVFLTAVAIRGALTGLWPLLVYAAVVLLVMQTAPARRAWPRLVPGRLFGGGDRMRRS